MKRLCFAALAAFVCIARLHAQSFTPSSGFTSTELFNLGSGFTISALGVNSSTGDLYYLASGNFGNGPDTQLFQSTASSNYANTQELFSYGSEVFGSFVKVNGSTVYFGENSIGTIRSISASGGTASLLGTVAGNYDAAFSGSNLFVSANVSGTDNKVYRLLSGGQLDTVLDTGGDYSGPILFDSHGNLIYGATNFGSVSGGVYSFTSAQVTNALDSNPSTQDKSFGINSGTRLFNNGNNEYLALTGSNKLFTANSPFGSPAIVDQLSLTNTNATPLIVGLSGTGEFFSGLAANGNALFVTVTSDFAQGPSAVYEVVPEPALPMLIGVGALAVLFSARRARKQK